MNESMRKIIYYENILEFKQNTKSELRLEEVNDWRLCRTCLIEAKEGDWDLKKMCVMDAFEGRFLNAYEMLDKVTNLKLNEGDDMPRSLCRDCLEKLTSLYFFSLQVQKAEKVLTNLSVKLKMAQKVGEDTYASNPAATDVEEDKKTGKEEEPDNVSVGCSDVVVYCAEDINERLDDTTILCKSSSSGQIVEPMEHDTCTSAEECQKNIPEMCKELFEKQCQTEDEKDEINAEELNEEDIKESNTSSPHAAIKSSDSPMRTESPMESTEIVIVTEDEDFTEVYEYEYETCMDTDETSNNLISESSEEIILNDEDEEYLEDKFNGEEESANTYKEEGDVEIVIPNTYSIEENLCSNEAEPVRLTRAKRIKVTQQKRKSKHRQKRVANPLLESKTCDICQEPFKLQRDLVAHVKEQHPNSKAYQCRECGQSFSYTQSLSRHMNTHKVELNKYQCQFCPKAFLRPDDLTRHIRTHTGERPYKCPQCDKAFKQQGEMKQHLTTHMERRSYECDLCCSIFTSRNSLYLHKKSNHPESENRNFVCLLCRKIFRSNQELLDHKKKQHVKNIIVQFAVVEEGVIKKLRF